MTKQSQTPFTDKFFQAHRQVTYFALGSDSQTIFEHFRTLDLSNDESLCLFTATGIETTTRDWCIGVFDEPVVVCGDLYPKHTLAVFQGRSPGKRFALFSADYFLDAEL